MLVVEKARRTMDKHPDIAPGEKEPLDIPPPSMELTSTLIRRVVMGLDGKDVSVGYLVIQFRRRSFGGIFLVLSALGLVPGISTIAGLAMLIPAFQLALGFRAPLLPRFVRRRRVAVTLIRLLADKVIPWIERIECFSRPRWFAVTHVAVQSLLGMMAIGLAVLVVLPLPFSNFPPALAFLAISIGMMQRDGLLLFLGVLLAMVAIAIGGFMVVFAIDALELFLAKWV